jgi:hypothetical protein
MGDQLMKCKLMILLLLIGMIIGHNEYCLQPEIIRDKRGNVLC